MPFFFDLSSLLPLIERNPFAPVQVEDEVPAELETSETPAEPIVDTGLPIPAHYDLDLMRALVQDPFHLFVHWQLKTDPFERLRRVFPQEAVASFRTVLKLIDETNRISVFFEAPFAREYWFSVFPDRTYRVELGLRAPQFGFIKLLSSQSVPIPRGAPSDLTSEDARYQVSADEYIRVLRDSHLVPERALNIDNWFNVGNADSPEAAQTVADALPPTFRRILRTIGDIQAGRDYDRLWERLEQDELTDIVRDFLQTMGRTGNGELGYLLLLRYLPELLRRVLATEGEIQIDEPVSIYFARKMGLGASEINQLAPPAEITSASSSQTRPWFPSATM
ncbi:MAG: DUF4912 domain-containing protein [Acidobacteriota bacterium]